MKYLKWIYIFCVMLIVCGLILKYIYPSINRENNTLSQFMIGRWIAEFPEANGNGIYTNRYQLEFIGSNRLILDRSISGVEENNIDFYYTFTAEDQIKLNARAIDEWKIYRDGDDLMVISTNGLVENGRYERRPVIEWPLIGLLVGMFPIGLLFLNITNFFVSKNGKNLISDNTESQVKPYGVIIHRYASIILFFIGLVIAFSSWPLGPIWKMRIPWDGIISFEIGSALIILGIKGFRVFLLKVSKSQLIQLILFSHFGALLLGSGFGISILGLIKICLFWYLGSYPH
jgi:hypothetical protein